MPRACTFLCGRDVQDCEFYFKMYEAERAGRLSGQETIAAALGKRCGSCWASCVSSARKADMTGTHLLLVKDT